MPSFSSACCATASSRDDGLKSKSWLRHQLNVLQQRAPRRLYLTWANRALFVWLYRGFPHMLDAIMILRPETIVRWHRKGFSAFWRWKSCPVGGRPQIDKEVRDLIRRMSFENPLWGAPHIHVEARLRRRPVDSLEVHDTEARSTVANMEDLPSRPRRRDRVD